MGVVISYSREDWLHLRLLKDLLGSCSNNNSNPKVYKKYHRLYTKGLKYYCSM